MRKGRRKVILCGVGVLVLVALLMPVAGVLAAGYTTSKGEKIVANCDYIKTDLKELQKSDSKARLYLGGHYETIITKYVKALNVKLVENDESNAKLLENQADLVEKKAQFAEDFVNYQRGLEELVGMSCETETGKFYEKLETVREKRKVVRTDVGEMDALISQHENLVREMMEAGDV